MNHQFLADPIDIEQQRTLAEQLLLQPSIQHELRKLQRASATSRQASLDTYFYEHVHRIAYANYIPTWNDYVRLYEPTRHFQVHTLARGYQICDSMQNLNNLTFLACLASGEMRKLNNVFQGVSCLVYMIALDKLVRPQNLGKIWATGKKLSNVLNCIELNMFEETMSSKWFTQIPVIVVFAKVCNKKNHILTH